MKNNNVILKNFAIEILFLVCYTEGMKKIEINDYFKKSYLTCGNTYDNYIFHNCPKSFLQVAYDSLNEDKFGIRPCMVRITKEDEEYVHEVVDYYVEYAEYYETDLGTFLANYVGIKGISNEKEFGLY